MALFSLKKSGYLFLIPGYFIIHNALQYYYVVDFSKLLLHCVAWMLLPAVLYLPIRLRYRNKPRTAGIITALFLFFFFYYSPIYNLLHQTPALQWFTKISVLLTLLALAIAAVFVLHRHIRFEKSRLPQLIVGISMVLIAYDTIVFFKQDAAAKTQLQPQFGLDTSNLLFRERPDIYYLIFDEHVSIPAAATYLGFNNLNTDRLLKEKDFTVSNKAVSAYIHTTISLAANFWTSPFIENKKKKIELTNYQLALYNLERNPVIPVFLKNGYTIVNTADYKIYPQEAGVKKQKHFGNIEQVVLNQTFAARIQLQVQSILNDRYPGLLLRSGKFQQQLEAGQQSVYALVQQVEAAAASTNKAPRFVYAHFSIPHLPVLFDTSFMPIDAQTFLHYKNKVPDTAAFHHNLLVAQKIMLRLIDSIQQKQQRPAIIIVQSDHGYRGVNGAAPPALKHAILSAVSGPASFRNMLPDELYAVNTFRLLLQQLTGKEIPQLPIIMHTTESELLHE